MTIAYANQVAATPDAQAYAACAYGAENSLPVSWSDMLPHRDYLVRFAKRKLQDLIRQRARYDSLDASAEDDGAVAGDVESPFARPDELAEQRQRLAHTMQRITTLPPGLRDVMQFRVLQDESSEAVCQRLNISEASLFVRLHRARKQLLC
jgi:RNA polymerase sigma-70 factor (ECF subfamily)